MVAMLDEFTSTGAKFFAHEEAMNNLRNGKGQVVTSHLMPTDLCQHDCVFCSVSNRPKNVLALDDMLAYVDTLRQFGLKAVIISGGGNPILYKHGEDDLNDLIEELDARNLEIGLITNGMPLKSYNGRMSWKNIRPETLDLLTWVRISMSGLDHAEKEVYVPDIDKSLTTLGFSYVYYDETRDDWLEDEITYYTEKHKPHYVRLLPDCLGADKLACRVGHLKEMAKRIDPDRVFVQYKPGKAPNACYLGYVHPVLNSDGYVYPCDSCILNETAGRKFAEPWRMCHWSEIARIYQEPVHSLISDTKKMCGNCVFTKQNLILEGVVKGEVVSSPSVPGVELQHLNFV